MFSPSGKTTKLVLIFITKRKVHLDFTYNHRLTKTTHISPGELPKEHENVTNMSSFHSLIMILNQKKVEVARLVPETKEITKILFFKGTNVAAMTSGDYWHIDPRDVSLKPK